MVAVAGIALREILEIDFRGRVEEGSNFLPGYVEAATERAEALKARGADFGAEILPAIEAVRRAYFISFTRRMWFTRCGIVYSMWRALLCALIHGEWRTVYWCITGVHPAVRRHA